MKDEQTECRTARGVRDGTTLTKFVLWFFNLLSLAVIFQKGCEIMEWKRGDEKDARGLDKEVNIMYKQ